MSGLAEFLVHLDHPPEGPDLDPWLPLSGEALRVAVAVAAGDLVGGPWGCLAAVRLLARTGGPAAAEGLARMLGDLEDPDCRLAEEALVALVSLGPEALPPLLRVLEVPATGRELAIEAALQLVGEYRAATPEIEALRGYLEHRFVHSRLPADRALFAGYLGDLGVPASAGVLRAALANPRMTRLEYDALREALERLGEECPAFYFDQDGHPYPVDPEGGIHCLMCGAPLRLDPHTDRPVHPEGMPGSTCPVPGREPGPA